MAASNGPGYSSFVDDDAEEYTASVIDFEDRAAAKQRKACSKRDLPHISPEAARTLAILVHLTDADRVLEIGTCIGYSGGFLAQALDDDGTLVTVEKDEDFAEQARDYFQEIDVADRVDVRVGDAREVLPELDPPFDLAFIDADKASYPDYLDEALRLVPVGGAICADNMYWQGEVFRWIADDATKQIVEYGRRIGADDRLLSTILPLGDGLGVSAVVSS